MVGAVLSKDPSAFVGRRVTVCVTSIPMKRDGFHTQISVEGLLQKHPDKNEYRVLASDGTFAYFTPPYIDHVLSASSPEWNTRSGSVAVVFLKFQS